tara:strand:+ start:472 stop:687 length:216 start_codon:yes stop_codon:yes gene_type:complete
MRWNKEIKELEDFFNKAQIPSGALKLNEYSSIKDCTLFIKSNLATVKANNGKDTYLPYLDRLKELRNILNQ